MSQPLTLQQVEEKLGFAFRQVIHIHPYYYDSQVFPESYRSVVTMEEEMARDWNGGTAFLGENGEIVGINLYACKIAPDCLQAFLDFPLPHLQSLNLNQTGLTSFSFTEKHPLLVHVNLSQNEALTSVHFDSTPRLLQTLDVYDSRVKSLEFPAGLSQFYKLNASRNLLLESLAFKGCLP